MSKIKALPNGGLPDYDKTYYFMCPGCKVWHAFSLSIHKFNQNFEAPTLQPSYLLRYPPSKYRPTGLVCHSFIVDGNIRFLNDCTHELAGRTVMLPEIGEEFDT